MEITVNKYNKVDSVLGDYVQFELYLENETGEEKVVIVNCSNTLKAIWGKYDSDLFNSLYQLIRQEIIKGLEKETFDWVAGAIHPLVFNSYNSPPKPPKVKHSLPETIHVNLSQNKTGVIQFFLTSTANVPQENKNISFFGKDIAGHRDNINTIFKKKWRFKLFNIEQERAIVDMYLPCDNKGDFTRRITALRDLISWMDKKSINKFLKTKIPQKMGQ